MIFWYHEKRRLEDVLLQQKQQAEDRTFRVLPFPPDLEPGDYWILSDLGRGVLRRLCAHCDALSKQYRKEEQDLQEYCRNNGLSVHLGKRGIWVRSPRSEWRIIADDTRAGSKLYHKNDLHPGKRSSDLLTAYHDQKVSYSKLLKYLDYIVEHDYYRMLNPIYPVQHKAPPVKGTKRYRKQLKQQKKKARKDAVRNVLTLIDSLSVPQSKAVTA